MFQYYFMLGVRSLRRNPALTALMVLILAVGVAASVSTLTILHVMSGDPYPDKSERMIVPMVDNGPIEGYTPGDERNDNQASYRDAVNFLNSKQGDRRTALYGVAGSVEPERTDIGVFTAEGLAPTRDFFDIFEVPFMYGQAWSASEDKDATDVIVLSRKLSEKLYGSENPVGKRIKLMNNSYLITGVINNWRPVPRVHRIIGGPGAFGDEDEFFIPFTTTLSLNWPHEGTDALLRNGDNEELVMNPIFERHLRRNEHWTLGEGFAKAFPQLAGSYNYKDPNGVITQAVELPPHA